MSPVLAGILALGGFPLAAWVGGMLTRPGRVLHGLVARHFRLSVALLAVVNIASRIIDGSTRSRRGYVVEVVSSYALAMLFVPMLRRLREQTDLSLRLSRAESIRAENASGKRPQAGLE